VTTTPRRAVAIGAAAGIVGTAALTAYQTITAIRKGSSLRDAVDPDPPDEWDDAPAPAQVGYRFLRGVFEQDISSERAPMLANVVHWLYGTGWGALYGVAVGGAAVNPLVAGAGFGSLVWVNAYLVLPAMGIYDPPWEYDKKTLAKDWSYHLVYGVTTAAAFRLLGGHRDS
jgi:hypothetical protein